MRSGESSGNCAKCKYLKGKRCALWEVKVTDPTDQWCESGELPDRD
jgi:hypothetical protein